MAGEPLRTSAPSRYPEEFIWPMREELRRAGFEELRTEAAVTEFVENRTGTQLVVVNSVCGCAARSARPGVLLALQQSPARPRHLGTVFAGADVEATARARGYCTGYKPSSPAVALFRDGQFVYMMERHQIEGHNAQSIAAELARAFAQHCQD